jgi:flagellar hook-length control protein FliK
VTTPTLAAAPDQPARPVDAPPAVIPDVTAEADESATEMAGPAEGAITTAQAGPTVRDLSLSTLSRATIDATAQFAAQILRKLEGRSTRFEMALTPDDLGRVDVRLDIDSEGRLAARLAFDNPAAATDLRGRADELRRQLEDAGFHLADDAFEFAERDSGSSAFDRGQNDRSGQNRAFAAASRLNAEIDVAQPPRWMALSLSPSGVDLKV